MRKIHYENENYTIVASIDLDECDLVLGYNQYSQMWVTWEYTHTAQYHWGHYFVNEYAAKKDYAERILNIINFQNDHTPWD